MGDPIMDRALGAILAGDGTGENSYENSVALVVEDDGKAGWAATALREARDAASRRLNGAPRAAVHAVIDQLRAPEALDAIKRRGVRPFRAVLVALLDGVTKAARDRAKQEWSDVDAATFDARRKALLDHSMFSTPAPAQIQADWKAFEDALDNCGPKAFVAAIPFLLKAITETPTEAAQRKAAEKAAKK